MSRALGQSNDLLAVKLDVTSRADAEAAVRAAVDRILVEQVLYPTMPRFDHVNQRDPQRGDRHSRYGCGWEGAGVGFGPRSLMSEHDELPIVYRGTDLSGLPRDEHGAILCPKCRITLAPVGTTLTTVLKGSVSMTCSEGNHVVSASIVLPGG